MGGWINLKFEGDYGWFGQLKVRGGGIMGGWTNLKFEGGIMAGWTKECEAGRVI